jgi:hypothetical protein
MKDIPIQNWEEHNRQWVHYMILYLQILQNARPAGLWNL